MAKLNLDYYGGEDLYSDGDVENEILEIAKKGFDSQALKQVKFPVLYHLSKVRENILNWYPFDQTGTCLEIGSGCGAITGLLCERLSHVTSVELSRRRAEVNYTRHKELDNLEICVGNLNDMQFPEKFDYVILNGVFEYAMGFTPGEHPYETFLNNIKKFLKPEGILIVAIENRLGLKYFAGAPEDHTDAYFDGIRGYKGNRSVRTFSKSEWEALMRNCGFFNYQFYYPYPDYKFPKEIFTDKSLKEQKYGKPCWNFTQNRLKLFEENEMSATLQQEGIMDRFANSFLIEMSTQPIRHEREIFYAKLGTDRAEQFQILTLIEESPAGQVVTKRALNPSGIAHIQKMYDHQEQLLPGKLEQDAMIYPFLECSSLARNAADAIQKKDVNQLHHLIDKVAELCIPESGAGRVVNAKELTDTEKSAFAAVFGDDMIESDMKCIAPANIDLILDNIFETENGYQVIDGEWIFDFPIPCQFILWRAINELYSIDPVLEKIYAKKQFMEDYRISERDTECFWRWATYFAEQYVGANQLLNISKPLIPISLETYRRQISNSAQMNASLYIDTGNGFSEDQKLEIPLEVSEGRFFAEYLLDGFSGVKALRFDPLEGNTCICSIDKDKTSLRFAAANAAAKTEQGELFLTTDPSYLAKQPGNHSKVIICGSIMVLSMEEALQQADKLLRGKISKKLTFWR